MTVFLCLDDRNGMLFHNRRLSRDQVLCERILAYCGGGTLWMTPYSATIFPTNEGNIRVCENFPEEMKEEDFCFVENGDVLSLLKRAKKLVIYRWNRCYPADVKLPDHILSERKPVSTVEFAGSSHCCITQEVYEL